MKACMKYFLILCISVSTHLLACSGSTAKESKEKSDLGIENSAFDDSANISLSHVQADTSYLSTGFYFIAEEGKPKIKMIKDHSDEIYFINPTPFVSVKNVIQAKLESVKLENGESNNLCLKFNEDGQKDLKEGSSKALKEQIAVVVAGHLLYLIEVNQPITDSTMCIILIGYSKNEMQLMLRKVNEKK
jgi:hypothetical protein